MRKREAVIWGIAICLALAWHFKPSPSRQVDSRIDTLMEAGEVPDIAVLDIPGVSALEPASEEPSEFLEPKVLKRYEGLYSQNNDMIGFLYLSDEYRYPVMRRVMDQNYYLDHNFFGEEDKEGSVFANRYSSLGSAGVSLLYGHTLKSGRMFSCLKNYQDADYFQTHQRIQLDTLYQEMYYQVVAVALTSLNEDFDYFGYVGDLEENEFEEWKQGFEPYVVRGTLSDLEYGDIICELSCCAYHVRDGRLVVILKAVG